MFESSDQRWLRAWDPVGPLFKKRNKNPVAGAAVCVSMRMNLGGQI